MNFNKKSLDGHFAKVFFFNLLASLLILATLVSSISLLVYLLDYDNTIESLNNRSHEYKYRYIWVNLLLLTPAIETLFIYFIWLLFVKIFKSVQPKVYLYALITCFLAWFAHGATFGAIFPTIMFFIDSVFLGNMIVKYDNGSAGYIGAVIIHSLYNLPYVVIHSIN